MVMVGKKLTYLTFYFNCVFLQSLHILAANIKRTVICSTPLLPSSSFACGPDEVISNIRRATIGHYFNSPRCDVAAITSWVNGGQDPQCITNIGLRSCHGSQSCAIPPATATAWLLLRQCRVNGAFIKILYIEYECHKFERSTTLVMGRDRVASGRTIDLLSPDFPCGIPQNAYSVACTISHDTETVTVRVSLKIQLIDLSLPCVDYLYISHPSIEYRALCSNSDPWGKVVINNGWQIGYENEDGAGGGKFWVVLEGWQGNNRVDISLSCNNPATTIQLEDQCALFQTTTTSPATTSTMATTTSAKAPTVATVTSATSTEEMNSDFVKGEDTKADILPGVVGGVVGFLVLVALIVLIVICCMRRKKQRSKDPESPGAPAVVPSAPPEENVGIYAVAAAIDENSGKGGRQGKSYDNVVIVDNGALYTTVNKAKKNEVKSENLGEETIMWENDELYTTSDDVRGKNTDANDDTTDGKNEKVTNDNQYEKLEKQGKDDNENDNTKYESLIKSEDKSQNENDDHDSVIMYENNELYSSSVDLTEDEREMNEENEYENTKDKNENKENNDESEKINDGVTDVKNYDDMIREKNGDSVTLSVSNRQSIV